MKETTPRIIWMVSLSFCLLCAGAFGYLVVGAARKKAVLFREDILPKLAYSAQLNSYQAEGYARLLLMIETDDAQKRQAYEAEGLRFWQQIDAILGEYDTAMAHADAAGQRCFASFVEKRHRYREIASQVRELLATNQVARARTLAGTELTRAYHEYTGAGDMLSDYERRSGTMRALEIESACAKAQLLTTVICIALFFAGLFSPLVLALLFITKPSLAEVPGGGPVV